MNYPRENSSSSRNTLLRVALALWLATTAVAPVACCGGGGQHSHDGPLPGSNEKRSDAKRYMVNVVGIPAENIVFIASPEDMWKSFGSEYKGVGKMDVTVLIGQETYWFRMMDDGSVVFSQESADMLTDEFIESAELLTVDDVRLQLGLSS